MLQTLKHDRSPIVTILGVVSAGLVALALACAPALAQGKGGVLRIGMTAADIPYTGGIPDQGFEGYRFIVEDAPWVFIVHDLNPRAMSPKVKGFVQPQSWFVDLTLPWVEE